MDGREDLVQLLLAKGAHINARDDEWWTPLHAAASAGSTNVVKYACMNGHRAPQ